MKELKINKMRGILEYIIPQEEEEFKAAQKGVEYAALLKDIFLYMKSEKQKGNDFTHYDDLERAIKDLMKKHDI